MIAAVRAYQHTLSPLLGALSLGAPGLGGCRFHPSCSEYAVQAISREGALRGGWRAVRRLARCHPFSRGGLDLPPERK